MRIWTITLCVASVCLVAQAKDKPTIDASGINMGSNYVYNLGFLDVAATSNNFTDAEVAHNGISVGQLVGINPETGQIITNAVNLLPIMARSAFIAGEVNAGLFSGDGAGLTNLNGEALVGYIPVGSMPTSGVWNISGMTLKNANFEGPLSVGGQALDIDSDLNVQGTLSGNASGLSNIPAGGSDGSIQFNAAGQLEGNTNYFIHAETEKLGFYATDNIFRAYAGHTTAGENLIYVVRRYGSSSELCLLDQGTETIRFRGDGTAYIAGDLTVGGEVTFENGVTMGGENWYIPAGGDLSMGTFTQQ